MRFVEWLVGPEAAGEGKTTHLLPRWIWLRALGLIYFSAFYPFLFQIKGLIGPEGISPAGQYLVRVKEYFPGIKAAWFAPTLFWFGSSDRALMIVCWVGIAASLAVIFNLWPRLSLFVCLVCFFPSSPLVRSFLPINQTGCCWKRDSFPCFSRRRACV